MQGSVGLLKTSLCNYLNSFQVNLKGSNLVYEQSIPQGFRINDQLLLVIYELSWELFEFYGLNVAILTHKTAGGTVLTQERLWYVIHTNTAFK